MVEKPPIRILIVNPNTNQSMTDSLREPIESLNYNNTTYTYLTPPPHSGPYSIDTPHDAHISTAPTFILALPHLPTHNAVLIACYSPHPLIPALRADTPIPILGIFEASISVALTLLREGERFGIVSTGEVWRGVLGEAVVGVLGKEAAGRVFAGVECVGVGAGELHKGGVEGRVRGAVRRLVGECGSGKGKGRVGVVILGCAGMVGMEEWVRRECGEGVRVVDGVKAGVGILQGLVRGGF